MNFIKKTILSVLFLISSLTFSTLLWARGGGGGGGHGGGGHGGGYSSYGGSSGSHYYGGGGSYDSSGPLGFMSFFTIAIFIIIFFMLSKRNTDLNSSESSQRASSDTPIDHDLKMKIGMAFLTIQKSWSEKRLDLMRRFITDVVYQRFNAQFKMMNLLDQTNVMSNVRLKKISLIEIRTDGNYDVMEVRIEAYAEDQFVSLKFPVINSPGGGEDFVEYWSFIRRKDYKIGSDIFHSELCPKCSAPLQAKLLETAQCPYCSTYLNSGEYDWVLAEITQENDYNEPTSVTIPEGITQKLPDFSKKLIEDRGSNAFMQILIACADKEEAPLARFSTANAFVELKKIMSETSFLYDRLFLNYVDMTDVRIEDNSCVVNLDILYSFRRVRIQNGSAKLMDNEIITENRKLTMIRELGGADIKGSIYANSCSHCGAAQKDSLSSVCAYCNQPLNDPKTEWIVGHINL